MSTRWHCGCNVPWITCQSCRGIGFACRKQPSLKKQPDHSTDTTCDLPQCLHTRRRRAERSALDRPLCKLLRKIAGPSSGSACAKRRPNSCDLEVRWPRPEPSTKPLRQHGSVPGATRSIVIDLGLQFVSPASLQTLLLLRLAK